MDQSTRIGIVVDGISEFRSLPFVLNRIDTNAVILRPLRADIQPHANISKIVKAVTPSVKIFVEKNCHRIIICVDHENQTECIPRWRDDIEAALIKRFNGEATIDVKVAVKAEMYENWLVADTSVFERHSARFSFTNAHERQVSPNKADRTDALKILKSAANNSSYHKVDDAVLLMKSLDPYRAAANSRSLRRFLRLVGCNTYSLQSKSP